MIVLYLLIAVCGLFGTWLFNISSFTTGEEYLGGWFASAASSSAAVDVLVTAAAAGVFFVVEGRRLRMRYTWILIPLTFVLALAFTFPLFLAWRERVLARSGAEVSVAAR